MAGGVAKRNAALASASVGVQMVSRAAIAKNAMLVANAPSHVSFTTAGRWGGWNVEMAVKVVPKLVYGVFASAE